MSLATEDADIDHLARKLAELTGESVSDALKIALAERFEREALRRKDIRSRADAMLEIATRFSALPDLDPRSADEIIGYDETGMWR